jgi:chromosome segregation ATPase
MKLQTAFLLALCVATGAALAQTPPPKPAPKPAAKPAEAPKAAEGKTLAIGGGAGTGVKPSGPILTREELRACLNQEEALRVRLETHDKGRGPLDQEKTTLAAEQAALRGDRAAVDDAAKKGEEFKTRQAAYAAKVEDWNKRVAAHNDDKNSRSQAYEQNAQRLNREKAELEKERTELTAEVDKWSAAIRPQIDAFNAKAKATDERVTSWNERNAKWNENGRALESERQTWVAACADRRYREDDEKAIRAGK